MCASTYTLYADRADGTYSGIDRTHAHLDMPATFMSSRWEHLRPPTVRIKFNLPTESKWKVGDAARGGTPGTPRYLPGRAQPAIFLRQPDRAQSTTRCARGQCRTGSARRPFAWPWHHAGTEAEVDAKVCIEAGEEGRAGATGDLFGELAPYDFGTYTFIADYLPWVSGDGMEHRNSTILASAGSLVSQNAARLASVRCCTSSSTRGTLSASVRAVPRAVRSRAGEHVGRALVRRRFSPATTVRSPLSVSGRHYSTHSLGTLCARLSVLTSRRC